MVSFIIFLGFIIISIMSFCFGGYIHYKSKTSYPHFIATQQKGGDFF